MKLNGPNQPGSQKNLKLRDFDALKEGDKGKADEASASSKSLVDVVKQAADRSDLKAVNNSLQTLAEHDRRASLTAGNRLHQNEQKGFETLIQFKDSDDKAIILAVHKEDEVHEYAALVSGAAVDSELDESHKSLKKAGQESTNFYLERDGKYLPTDAAGAALSLSKKRPVVVQRADGQVEVHKQSDKALSFVSQSDPEVAAFRSTLKDAKEKGLTFAAHEVKAEEGDDETKSKDSPGLLSRIGSMFGGGGSEVEVEEAFAEKLKSGLVDVSFEDDERPLALPVTLSMEEIKLAADWEDNPSKEIENFRKDFKAMTEDETILMTQQAHGQMKGAVLRADDRSAYFQLRQGNRMVVLDKKGDLHELNNLEDFAKFKKDGRVTEPNLNPFDGEKTDSDNLMMFYHVAPFDPIEKGIIDDLPLRLTKVGSSEQLDIVTMRSDLPTKKNLRVDRAQIGEQQELKRLDAEIAMNDPKVLENFVYETVKANMGDDKIRFLIGGHGGAEKGLLPDGEHNNADANHAMPVDDFAGAIKKALDRVQNETGERPRIDNIMFISCLMGNTSFIHALAETGDIDSVIASPELMAGSNPLSTFEFLADPKTSKASGLEYAQHILDEWSQAPAMVGGSMESQHADTIGAYDLSPEKAKRFQKALGGFFDAVIAEPEYGKYLKENIAKAPAYGINPLINLMFDVDNRDLLQVLDHAKDDARITSPKVKKAMKELMEATEAQVIDQRVSENYEGRRGPSLYLPLDRWDMNEKMTDTELLKSVKYKEFMDVIFDAPLQRSVADNFLNEASRLSESGALDKAFKKIKEAAQGGKKKKKDKTDETQEGAAADKKVDEKKAEKTEASKEAVTEGDSDKAPELKLDPGAMSVLKSLGEMVGGEEVKELQELHALETDLKARPFQKAFGLVRGALSTGLGLTAGLVGGTIGAVPGAIFGAFAGARAGWTGTSASGTHKPASKEEMEVLAKVVDELLEANEDLLEVNPTDDTEEATTDKVEPEKTEVEAPKLTSKDAAVPENSTIKDKPVEAKSTIKDKPVSETADKEEPKVGEDDTETDEAGKSEGPDLSPLRGLFKGRVAKGIKQLFLWPSEGFAIKTHESVGRKHGEMPGRIVGALTGAVTGALFNALATGGIAFVGTGLYMKSKVDKAVSALGPKAPTSAPDVYIGRFEKTEEDKSTGET